MVEHDGESPFVICDYGAADGRTTHAVIDACIGNCDLEKIVLPSLSFRL